MGTLNAIYVRAQDANMVQAIRDAYLAAVTERHTQFFSIERALHESDCPEEELRLLAARLKTDVIWLSFQSTVETFEFFHWHNGAQLRCLIRAEAVWERIEGDPEPWEQQAIFEADDLAEILDCYDDPTERNEVEQIYLERILAPGNFNPLLDARETARAVAEFYRLPGWCFEDDDSPMFRGSLS
jgi:hypothetical protein